jgi:hypothetical protein
MAEVLRDLDSALEGTDESVELVATIQLIKRP